jgi:hypothetical protein
MSNYFKNFPKVAYRFGNEDQPVSYQKLSKYVDVIDTLQESISAYIEYEIRDFDRPDTLSHRFYGTSEYEWTFFLMNDRLRESGWPLAAQDLYDAAQNDFYKNYTCKLDISTADSAALFANLYSVGQSVLVGDKEGKVVHKDLDLGEIVVSSDTDLTTSMAISYIDSDVIPEQPLTVHAPLTNTVYEYEGTHHYENDSGEWVNIFFDDNTLGTIPKTNLEHLIDQNDQSKRIRIIRKQDIQTVVAEYKRLMEIR